MDSIILSPAPMPYLTDCSLKRFGTDEYHCSRYCSHFVLIFMLKNRLQFTENGSMTTLLAGEWYIQKKIPGRRLPAPAPMRNIITSISRPIIPKISPAG